MFQNHCRNILSVVWLSKDADISVVRQTESSPLNINDQKVSLSFLFLSLFHFCCSFLNFLFRKCIHSWKSSECLTILKNKTFCFVAASFNLWSYFRSFSIRWLLKTDEEGCGWGSLACRTCLTWFDMDWGWVLAFPLQSLLTNYELINSSAILKVNVLRVRLCIKCISVT